jgi:GAF domain-containing protein/HAMP domain-containing protein
MEELFTPDILLIFADVVGMVSVILALYILVLNPRELANRLASLAIGILAVNTLVLTSLGRASNFQEAFLPTIFFVSVVPAIGPVLLMATLAMLKPAWISGKNRWILYLLIFLAFIPGILTLLDLILGTSYYYIRPNDLTYGGGIIQFADVVSDLLGQVVLYIDLIFLDTLIVIPLIYFGFFDRTQDKRNRGLALMLLSVQIIVLIGSALGDTLPRSLFSLVTGILYIIIYGAAAFLQLVSTRRVQRGKLQNRLTLMMMVITIPVIVTVALSLIRYAEEQMENDANLLLQQNTNYLVAFVDSWLNDQALVLSNLASLPDILSMDPNRQKPVLESYAENYRYMYLLSTTDTAGMNVARSDTADLTDYSDRFWFKNAAAGSPIAIQTLIGRTTGKPALVASVPITSDQGEIDGVAMFASHLTKFSDTVLTASIGETGYAYLIDNQNQLIVHPSLQEGSTELIDYSTAQPVRALRAGIEPPIYYTDGEGVKWRAYYSEMENGWAIIVQQQEAELIAPYRNLQILSFFIIGTGVIILFGFVLGSLRQAVQPINSLTQTVKDITAGNLDKVAPVESEDEVGTLAQAFNIMTGQVRSLISGLERRVAERTLDLETRSAQLQAAAEVGRAAATIRNLDELLSVVTRMISERFGFYHVGIFLLDEQRVYAILRATNSLGGQKMVARGHKLQVGQQGIVGHVTAYREPRVALNVGEDAAFFNNPDLPDTQSEMALPLLVGGELLGALDVQSTQPNAFTEQDVETLQVLADQVAIAINSAQLLQQTEALLETERRGYETLTRQTWNKQMSILENIGFTRGRTGLFPIMVAADTHLHAQLDAGQPIIDPTDDHILYLPVSVRGQLIGVMKLEKDRDVERWMPEEIDSMKSLAEQLGVALESARSYQQIQMSAERDRILGEISARIRETLDFETILRTATKEVRQVLDLPKVVVRLGSPLGNGGNGKSDQSGGSHA